MGTIALGSGMALGEHEVKNDDLGRVCDTSDDWIRERTGIHTRYYVADEIKKNNVIIIEFVTTTYGHMYD